MNISYDQVAVEAYIVFREWQPVAASCVGFTVPEDKDSKSNQSFNLAVPHEVLARQVDLLHYQRGTYWRRGAGVCKNCWHHMINATHDAVEAVLRSSIV